MNEALFIIDPDGDLISSSTFAPNSFKVTNNSSDQSITSITLDLSTAIFPDIAYDPDPSNPAGDDVTKGFEIDIDPSSNPASSGVTSHSFLKPLADGGFQSLKIDFGDFKPNQTLEFSVDVDPTSIKGAKQTTSIDAGSISGLELIGATATVEFADGEIISGQFYSVPNGDGTPNITASQVLLTSETSTAPTIEVVGLADKATVGEATQTIRVTGTAGTEVSLLIVEGALYVENGGFDIDPFEANTALAVDEKTATIGAQGFVDIPVVLQRTDETSGGLNHIVAKYQNSNSLSSTLVLELDPTGVTNPGDIPTAVLNAPALTDLAEPYIFTVTYSDNVAIKASTINFNDVLVYAPDGTTLLPVSFVGVEDINGDQSVMTASYSVAAPGGNWANGRGGYRVEINPGKVADTSENKVAAGILGNFVVNAPHNPSATGVIRIEAEDYKGGTNDVEFFDFDPANNGQSYRLNEPVDVEPTGDEGGGFNVGFVQAGEHLTYDVNIPQSGNYELILRVATPASEVQTIDVVIGGQTYTASFGSTGDFQVYQDVVLPNVNLEAGLQELRLNMQSNSFNLNYVQLEAKAPVEDKIAPSAQLDTTTLTQQASSPAAAIFTVTYTDNIALKGTTINADDVTVTAPDGQTLPVTLVGVNATGNGTPRVATYLVAAPGGTWDNADKGDYTVTLNANAVSDTSDNKVATSSLGSFSVDVTGGQTTTGDTIRIEAEDYKKGNNGNEYFDTSRGNFGGAHRHHDVDIEATADVGGGHNLAWIEAGEFLTYDVNIAKAGNYDLVLRVASPSKDAKSIDVVIGGQTYTASFNNTGGWQTYQDVVISNVNLGAGNQQLRLDMKSNGFNFNYLELVAKTTDPTGAIRIEAEDYKAGTNDVEYFDFEAANFGGEYRPGEPVDIEVTGDEGGGFNVAFIQAGEFLTYDVNIPETGNYNLVLRVASPTPETKNLDAVIGGKTYNATFSSTGDWQVYTDVVINNVNLTAGSQVLRLDLNSKDFNLNYVELVPAEPVVDAVAPVAKLDNTPDDSDVLTLNLLSTSTTTANFSVTYSDNIGIDTTTIDAQDITVTAPNGTVVPVTFVGVDNAGIGTPRTAVYSIAAPGGTWNAADIGDYTVAIKTGAVSDTNGNTVINKTLGKLAVDVLTPAPDGVIRINAGEDVNTVDSFGKLWQADANFTGGQAIDPVYNPIDNTEDDFIFQSQRLGANFSYAVPVDNGNYNVSLYLSELNFTDFGSRVFDVSLEGNAALDNVDIYKLTNNAFLDGENDASIVEIPDLAVVRDGVLNLDFTSVVDQATLAGIVITPIEDAQVLIEQSNQNTSVTEGGNTDTYQVLLNTQPTANVTVDLQLDGQTTTDKTSLIFTPQNWSTPQTVTVSAVDDTEGESFHTSTISHSINSSDAAYSGLDVPSVSVNIVDNDSVGVQFTPKQEIDNYKNSIGNNDGPSTGAWGPDGRLYVGLTNGQIKAYTFDDNYNIIDTQTIKTIEDSEEGNKNITGIAFNPFENTGGQPKIYVSHNQFYANGDAYTKEGGFNELTDFSPYSGQVSVLEGPDFSTITPVVDNIGISNHDHGVNGLAFDENGDLLITNGSNTNAGIADDRIGGIDESPFTAAIIKAEITKPGFNGNIQYQLPADWVAPEGLQIPNPEESQGFGGIVDVAPGVDVSVYASGLRNPYDLVFATNGIIYATENGANGGFGAESTGADTQKPFDSGRTIFDELNIIEEGNYYGQPNRNRGQDDPRQNIYHYFDEPSTADYTAPIADFTSSTNGIIEYRSNTFGGQLKGNLIAQRWNGVLYNVELSEDGSDVTNISTLEVDVTNDQGQTETKNLLEGLDVITGPGGALISLDHSDSAVYVTTPVDDSVTNMVAYDISDWRAPATGGGQFTIGGTNFSGVLADTTVEIGGKTATITSVTEKRIVGNFPAFALSDPIIGSTDYTEDQLLDITVSSAGQESILNDAFKPLFV
ncbi:MAG: carbohydrate-binding domain-containing protein [Cyanobacteria bacterium P01_G01_bin.39]